MFHSDVLQPEVIDPAVATVLTAGRFRAVFMDGRLQWLTVGDVEAVRRIYFAFRDEHWTTVPYAIDQIDARVGSDAFELTYTATARSASGDFRFTWEMEGGADDVIEIRLRGEALTRITKNRLGLCLHYPHELAGHPLRYRQVTDPAERQGVFPERIAPEQPLLGLGSISHRLPTRASNRVTDDLWCRASFHGDVWEMEDQRNFSDASYKVYSTPASDPIPVELEPGQTVEQRIVLELAEGPADVARSAASVQSKARPRNFLGAAALTTLVQRREAAEMADVDVEVGTEAVASVPALGTDISRLCTLEDAFPRSIEAIEAAAAATVRGLRLAHVRLEVDTSRAHWRSHLERGLALAAASHAKLELVVSSAGDTWPGWLAEAIAQNPGRVASVCVVAGAGGGANLGDRIGELRQKVRAAGTGVAIGSGTSGWFVELNQSDLPVGELDFLSYSLTPQVHAFDDDVLRENLHGQHDQLATAHGIAQGRELRVGPVTLRPRGSEAGATEALWPTLRDPRLDSSLGAVWTLGAIAAHAQGNAATLTLFEVFGPEAIATDAADAAALAIRTVMYEFAGLRGRALLLAGTSSPLDCVAFAVRNAAGSQCYLANLSEAPIRAHVQVPGSSADVTAMGMSAQRMSSLTNRAEPEWLAVELRDAADGKRVVRLEPRSVVRLQWSDRASSRPETET